MHDETEGVRVDMIQDINSEVGPRDDERLRLEERHGQVWDTGELQRDFKVFGFSAPFVVVHRKSDGIRGSLVFQHDPRFYFSFKARTP